MPFHLLDGTAVQVSMMHQTAELLYAGNNAAQILELPYAGGDLSMVANWWPRVAKG